MKFQQYRRWRAWFFSFWALILFITLGLLAARLFLLFAHHPDNLSLGHKDIYLAFFMGWRFDLKHLSVLLGPWLLISLMACFFKKMGWHIFNIAFWVYSSILLVLINLLSVINFYYFSFYQSPINALFFGLHEDDTKAILTTVWSDFPVLRLIVLLIVVTGFEIYLALLIQKKLSQQIPKSQNPESQTFMRREKWAFTLSALASVLLLTGLGRGSLGTFPLRTQHMNVSHDRFVNQLVPSGGHALHIAYKDRKRNQLGHDPNTALARAGFSHWQHAAKACGIPINADNGLDHSLPINEQASKSPPHVVFTLMESWGRHLLEFDDSTNNDLLGKLRPWLEEKADFFPQAVSIQNGTHPSLEGLILDTPITPLMQSSYGYQTYDTSRILPYKNSGYKTVFLTAGSASWRKLNPTLLQQGFDEIYDETAIKEKYPQAETHTWGVDDEWMFLFAEELLKEAEQNNEPIFLFMLSVTNHPPYRVPNNYTPPTFNLEPIKTTLATSEATSNAIMETYQYANNALGQFLNALEDNQLIEKVVFTATGDHTNRSIFTYPDSTQLQYKYGVPILFYIPKAYRHTDNAPEKNIWASHQDIFPTLWAHSLSETIVPSSSGINLYQPNEQEPAMALSFIKEGNSHGFSLSNAGAVIDPIHPIYLRWDKQKNKLIPDKSPSTELQEQAVKTKACLALSDWRIRIQALGKDNGTRAHE